MHATYVRVWFVAGLAVVSLSLPLSLSPFSSVAPTALVVGLAYLALALALGLLPAYARRDWPSPVYAIASVLLGGLGLAAFAAPVVLHALAGASLLLGALQPLALLLSPRWTSGREPNPHRATDAAALVGLALSLVGAAAGGALLIALPRGLPYAAFAALLLGCAVPAAIGALLFLLPRADAKPTQGATLAYGSFAAIALAAGALAWAFARPFGASFREPVALVALAYALAISVLLRAPRPRVVRPLLGGAFALAILAALALLLATLYGAPNALLPVAFYAHAALVLVALSAALVVGAPLLLPGRAREGRWTRWAPALLIAALFLYTPAIQYERSAAPAMIVGALGLALVVWGLASAAWPRS